MLNSHIFNQYRTVILMILPSSMLLVLSLKRFRETNTFYPFYLLMLGQTTCFEFSKNPSRSQLEWILLSLCQEMIFTITPTFGPDWGPSVVQKWSNDSRINEISFKAMHQHPRMEPFIAKNNTNEPKKDFSRQVEVPIFDTKFNVTVEFDPDRTIDYKLLKVLVKKNVRKNFKNLKFSSIDQLLTQ